MNAAEMFLMGKAPAAKFPTPGTTVGGEIIAEPMVEQERDFDTGEGKTWDNGDPKLQMVVTVQTDERVDGDDDGVRSIYVKSRMRNAVSDAVRKAKRKGLAVGGHLSVTYTGDGEKVGRKQPPKLYSAVYTPPTEEVVVPQEQPATAPF